jgi:hypothetical protein
VTKLLALIAPYRKAVAAALVPLGLGILAEWGLSPDLTLRDVLQSAAVAVAGGGAVYRTRNITTPSEED